MDDLLNETGLGAVHDVPSWIEAIGIVIAGISMLDPNLPEEMTRIEADLLGAVLGNDRLHEFAPSLRLTFSSARTVLSCSSESPFL